jgi:glucose-6-phosphate 1-dehydrogenase
VSNPFQDPLRFERRVRPCSAVIFGASGDLTKRKLIPALYRLACERRLPAGFSVIGTSRTPMSDDAFRAKMLESTKKFLENSDFEPDLWRDFAAGLFYEAGDLEDDTLYPRIAARLKTIETERHTGGNALFYLSTQPEVYLAAMEGLGRAGLNRDPNGAWRRVVIEKPFGSDLASARELNDRIHKVFDEEQIYRIDHYLGKETVQNILAFRFGNGIFEPLWNHHHIDHVQITGAEWDGVGSRAGYYVKAGALRDMVQNHLLQVLATVAMEPPATFEPNAVRDERAKLLRAIRVFKPSEVAANAAHGQYGPSELGGQHIPGFREEPKVPPDAQTATYAAVTFLVDNWRWAGVPFYVRTGKRLAKRVTDVAIQFHAAPHRIFGNGAGGDGDPRTHPTLLVLRIQPEEGISLRFLSKQPGRGMELRPVSMDFKYNSSFGARTPTAYETLLMDALTGDATLYTRQDMVEASWRIVEPILDVWENTRFDLPNYAAGTWGPAAADEMLARRGHVWRMP